jgi:tetratricopeptide (TPR) repeat protein
MKNIATGTILAVLMISAGAVIFSPTAAQQPPARSWCYGASTDDQRIAGCTQVIESEWETQKDVASAYFNRGLAYQHKGDLNRAIADYTQAVQLNPTAVYYINRCDADLRSGNNDQAITDCSEAIKLDPKLALAYANRCGAYVNKRENGLALADCNEAINRLQ